MQTRPALKRLARESSARLPEGFHVQASMSHDGGLPLKPRAIFGVEVHGNREVYLW